MLVSSFMIGVRTSLEFFYFFFWFLLSLIGVCLFWVAAEFMGAKLYLTRHNLNKITEDDFLEIEMSVRNRWFLPIFNFTISDHLSCAASSEKNKVILVEFLGARSSLRIKYSCFCPQRGKYNIGPFSVYFFDPFNLFFFKKTYPLYSDLYVYPRTFNIQKFPPLARGVQPWFGIETARVSGDDDEFFGIREYKPGDPIKKIHWVSTARKNSLIVKEFQRQNFFRATLIFNMEKDKNLGSGKESVAEYTIKIAASVAKYLIANGVSLEVIAHTGEMVHIPFNKGAEHLEDILRFFTIAQAESRINLGEIFEEFARYISNDSSLIVIMQEDDWKYIPAILSLQKRNVSLVPLILLGSTFLSGTENGMAANEAKLRLSHTLDFNTRFFYRGANLEEAFIKY